MDIEFSNLYLEHVTMVFTTSEMAQWMNVFSVLLDHRFFVSKPEFDSYFKWLVIYRQLQIKKQDQSSSTSERSSFTSKGSRKSGAFSKGKRILL